MSLRRGTVALVGALLLAIPLESFAATDEIVVGGGYDGNNFSPTRLAYGTAWGNDSAAMGLVAGISLLPRGGGPAGGIFAALVTRFYRGNPGTTRPYLFADIGAHKFFVSYDYLVHLGGGLGLEIPLGPVSLGPELFLQQYLGGGEPPFVGSLNLRVIF